VQACNRRSTPLEQVFPQRDWFVLEARHAELGIDYRWTEREWYDHRFQPLLNGAGYGDRDIDPVHFRVGDRSPRTVALTWYDGPQEGPDDVVVWAPGECKTLDVGAWEQTNLRWPELAEDFPALWRHRAAAPLPRTTPGRHTLHLNWGGVEVGQTRRYLVVDSPPFVLEGPRLTASLDRPGPYEPDQPVPITVRACNDSDRAYTEFLGERDVTGDGTVLELSVGGNYEHSGESLGVVRSADRELTWAAGECKGWSFTWDQDVNGRQRQPSEIYVLSVHWNPRSPDREQKERSPGFSLE
jgi:hypothetical protein